MEPTLTPHSQLQSQPTQSSDNKTENATPTRPTSTPAEREALSRFRKGLPIYKHRNEILTHVKKHPITIISGDTGSGKSTQLPQYLFESALNGNKMIGITQPRRVAALTLAQRVAQEVGYS